MWCPPSRGELTTSHGSQMERGVTAVERVRGSEHRERRIAWAAAAAAVALQAENWMCPHVRRRPSPFPERVAHARTTIAMHACRVRVGETEIREDIFFVAPALLCGGTGRAPRFLVRYILVKMQWKMTSTSPALIT